MFSRFRRRLSALVFLCRFRVRGRARGPIPILVPLLFVVLVVLVLCMLCLGGQAPRERIPLSLEGGPSEASVESPMAAHATIGSSPLHASLLSRL